MTHKVALTYPVETADASGVELRRLQMYITVGFYPSGDPGEVFIRVTRSEPDLAASLDAFCTALSVGLQHGIPLAWYCDKFAGTKGVFAAPATTSNPDVPEAQSPLDYLVKWLRGRFLSTV